MARLDSATVGALDGSGQLRELLDLPEHLRDGLWRVDSAAIRSAERPGGLIVYSDAGSAAAAPLARAVLGPRELKPVVPLAGGALPTWVDDTWTVLVASYSGAVQAPIDAFEAAGAAGARRIVASIGGPLVERARADGVAVIPLPGAFIPRHAIGYFTVIVLEVARLCGAAPALAGEVGAAADALAPLDAEWGPDGPEDSEPKRLARALRAGIPIIYGAGPTLPVAARLAHQIESNARRPAFACPLPAEDGERSPAGDDPALVPFALIDPTATGPGAARPESLPGDAIHIEASGETALERVLRLVHLGDLASLYLAVLDGTDPAG